MKWMSQHEGFLQLVHRIVRGEELQHSSGFHEPFGVLLHLPSGCDCLCLVSKSSFLVFSGEHLQKELRQCVVLARSPPRKTVGPLEVFESVEESNHEAITQAKSGDIFRFRQAPCRGPLARLALTPHAVVDPGALGPISVVMFQDAVHVGFSDVPGHQRPPQNPRCCRLPTARRGRKNVYDLHLERLFHQSVQSLHPLVHGSIAL